MVKASIMFMLVFAVFVQVVGALVCDSRSTSYYYVGGGVAVMEVQSAKCKVQSTSIQKMKPQPQPTSTQPKLHVGTTHHPPPGHHHHYGQTDEWRTDLCLGQTETVDGVETSFQCYCYSASHYLRYSQLSPIAVLLKVINYEYYEQ